MPYPLPDEGPPYSTDLRWFLVAVPDEAAFVQAALGAYTEFTHYWLWGKEGKEPGRNEAAQAWEDAVGATLEGLEMGFPDTLLSYIDGLETLLQTLIDSQCCQTGSPVSDLYTDDWSSGDNVPQNIVDAGFASSTSDQDGYTDYKCLVANVAVQDLIEKVTRLANLLDDEAGTIIGGIGAVVALLGFVLAIPAAATLLTAMTIGILLGVGAATTIASFAISSGKEGMNDLAEALELAYDDLVCAIYQADGNEAAKAAVSDAITTATSALDAAVLSLIINSVIDALYAGRYDQTNTAQALSDAGFTLAQHDCDCLVPTDFDWENDVGVSPDNGGWALTDTSVAAYTNYSGHGEFVMRDTGAAGKLPDTLISELGQPAGTDFSVQDVRFDYEVRSLYAGGLEVRFVYQDATSDVVTLSGGDLAVGQHSVTVNCPQPTKQARETGNAFFVELKTTGSAGGTSDASHTVWFHGGRIRGNYL